MNLSPHGNEIAVQLGGLLSAEYRPIESSVGLVTLKLTDINSCTDRFLKLRMDCWSPEGFKLELWQGSEVVVIFGAGGFSIIQLKDFTATAHISFEYQEYDSVGLPWITSDPEHLLVASQTRICCINRHGYLRWFWSIRESSKEFWRIAEKPKIKDESVDVPLISFKDSSNIELDLDAGFSIKRPRGWKL